jgi:hypothetical protein
MISAASNEETLAHEIGHWLGLRHTFNNTVYKHPFTGENVAMINHDNTHNSFADPDGIFCILCSTDCSCNGNNSGDMIPDTEVDVYYEIDGTIGNLCDFNATGDCFVTHVDPNGNTMQEQYYPDKGNLMSYYLGADHFSTAQQNRMQQVLTTHGGSIINNPGTDCESFPSPDFLGVEEAFVYAPVYDEMNNQHSYLPMEEMGIMHKDAVLSAYGGTDEEGSYTLNPNIALIAEDKDVFVSQKESKTDDFYSTSDFLDILDLIKLQKHIMGIDPLISPYHKIAADVSNTGNLGILDLIKIRKIILGLESNFAEVPMFRLVPRYALSSVAFENSFYQDPFNAVWSINNENRSYSEDPQLGVPSYFSEISIDLLSIEAKDVETWSFNAVKSGDVDNSFVGDIRDDLFEETTTQLYLSSDPHTCISDGEEFNVLVSTNQLQGIQGFQANFQIEGAKIRGLESMDLNGFSTTNFSVSKYSDLFAVWVNPEMGSELSDQRYVGEVNLFELALIAEKSICNISNSISVDSSIMKPMFIFEDPSGISSSLELNLEVVSSTGKLTINPPFPNPISSQVTIPFELTESKTVKLVIYDEFGFWYEDEEIFPAGSSSFNVSNIFDSLPNGRNLFYLLRADDEVRVGSFIKQ